MSGSPHTYPDGGVGIDGRVASDPIADVATAIAGTRYRAHWAISQSPDGGREVATMEVFPEASYRDRQIFVGHSAREVADKAIEWLGQNK